MSVPKAAVHENYSPVFWENNIRFPRQPFVIYPKSKAAPVQGLPDHQLGFGVLAPDTGHHPAADFGAYDVSHRR